jgi:hypothetical protein
MISRLFNAAALTAEVIQLRMKRCLKMIRVVIWKETCNVFGGAEGIPIGARVHGNHPPPPKIRIVYFPNTIL